MASRTYPTPTCRANLQRMVILWYIVLAILAWFAFWVIAYAYSATVLCPKCGGELDRRFSFLRGEGTYCKRCWYER